jgi:hypothetical protein
MDIWAVSLLTLSQDHGEVIGRHLLYLWRPEAVCFSKAGYIRQIARTPCRNYRPQLFVERLVAWGCVFAASAKRAIKEEKPIGQTMATASKTALCVLVLAATSKVMVDLWIWASRTPPR